MAQDTAAVVVAAGMGRRLGGSNKALLPLGGRPMLAWSLAALRAAPSIGQIIVVMSPADDARLRAETGGDARSLGADRVVPGGVERWESSLAGVLAADPALPLLLVHDAARPLLTADDVERVLSATRLHGAALLAEALADTLKQGDEQGLVQHTVDRRGLWRAQTPQAARRFDLLAAFAAWKVADKGLPTDEARLLEEAGLAPALVPASNPNFKVTLPHDLLLAEAILAARQG